MATARQIVSSVQRLVGEAAGVGVQIYSEDGMLEFVNRIARLSFTKFSWEHLISWREGTLDQTTGLITEEIFEDVKGLQDFLAIYREGDETPIPKLGRSVNPFRLTGTRAIGWTSLDTVNVDYIQKKIQFWPRTAEGVVQFCVRVDPTPFDWEDEVPMDEDIMVAGVAWQSLQQDDLNPGAAEGQKSFMDDRFSAIMKALALQTTTGHPGAVFPTEFFIRRP